MKPADFNYESPSSLDECVALLAREGSDAKPLAGGQSLVPMLNLRLADVRTVVDLNGLNQLDYINVEGDVLSIGAMTRQRALERSGAVRERCPMLARAAGLVGHPAIRNRGTIGGSLAHADPAAELATAAVALDAELVLVSSTARRVLSALDFFRGPFTTALRPGELLVEVRIPRHGRAWEFTELTRKTGDFALAAAAVSISVLEGRVVKSRVALGGVTGRPVRSAATEQLLTELDLADVGAALVSNNIRSLVWKDLSGSDPPREREHAAGVLVERALRAALLRAEHADE